MDKLNVFGDISYDSLKMENLRSGDNNNERTVSNRLNSVRLKALEALQKSHRSDGFKRPYQIDNKEGSKRSDNIHSNNRSTPLDHTDYVLYRRPTTINISDLVTDETINLESSSGTPSTSNNIKVSFEPTEITGRSTLYDRDNENSNDVATIGSRIIRRGVNKTKNISVSDILASSFAQKARNLCETLQCNDTTRSTSSILNGSRSLPLTADMSLSKNTCTEESFDGGFEAFSLGSASISNCLEESENFAPGELMHSKLLSDEISWAQEYAAIPSAALSEQAKIKSLRNSGIILNGFESPFPSNSMIAGDLNFSVGRFFNMRSENIYNIVKSKSPNKCRSPIALVDDNIVRTSSDLEGASKVSITPKIDNKTYTRIGEFAIPAENTDSLPRPSACIKHDSKDSGNASDNSYLLSISAIDRALCNLDIQSDVSGVGVSEQLLMEGKNSKSNTHTNNESGNSKDNGVISLFLTRRSLGTAIKSNGDDKINSAEEMILENKENVDPKNKQTSKAVDLADTISFNESLLNSTDMKNLQNSTTQSRSPLSPIDVTTANIRLNQAHNDDDGAENDKWPSTPISTNRSIRHTKSSRDENFSKSIVSSSISPDGTTPTNSRLSLVHTLSNKNISEKEAKSKNSLRVNESDRHSNTDSNFISPNISNGYHSASSLVTRSNTLCVPQPEFGRNVNPAHLDTSPMSSACSYQLNLIPSPTPATLEFQSSNLDATSVSDRQILNGGAVGKAVSSPARSETSSNCSCGTMQTFRSVMSGVSGRSISQCSTSSEFSHRDGKKIPLKVTKMELSWGSIKLRSDSRKSMQVKNIIKKRVVFRIEVSGPGFQIVNSPRSNTISMQSQECRTISVSFCPTVRGVAVGKLSFYAPCVENSFLDVPLYAYGGNANIITQNIYIGPVGSPFITMGDIRDLAQPLERIVSIYNKGPLLGFASITLDSIGLMMPRLSDAFEIYPRRVLIPPKKLVDVRIVFRPKQEEIKKLIKKMSGVLTLAIMRVICGDEANRQRIRRLLCQMTEEERNKFSTTATDMLWSKFPNESEISELNDIKEKPNVAMDLMSFLRIHEILLTINNDNMDDTFDASSLYLADVDDTVLFRTICTTADSPTPCNLATVDEDFEIVDANSVTNTWSVSPQTLNINIKKQEAYTLILRNGFKSQQFFEVACNVKNTLHLTPSDGYVPSGGETQINVFLKENIQIPSENVCIMVYMKNERLIVPVNITT